MNLKNRKNPKISKGITILEMTTVIGLILGLLGLIIVMTTIYTNAKEASQTSSMLREVYNAQLKYVNLNPHDAVQPDTTSARAKVYWEVTPPNKTQNLTEAQKSAQLSTGYRFSINNIDCSIYIPTDMRQPPYFATWASHTSNNPTRVDPSGNQKDGKYDVGNLAP
jgi:type II secretory pathway pseudopilin PulG